MFEFHFFFFEIFRNFKTISVNLLSHFFDFYFTFQENELFLTYEMSYSQRNSYVGICNPKDFFNFRLNFIFFFVFFYKLQNDHGPFTVYFFDFLLYFSRKWTFFDIRNQKLGLWVKIVKKSLPKVYFVGENPCARSTFLRFPEE